MTVIPVEKVLDSLFDSLIKAPKDQLSTSTTLINSISRIASHYTAEYESTLCRRLSLADASSWTPLVSHFESINTFVVSPATIDTILESSISRLFATDPSVRKAAIIPVRAVAEHYSQETLDRLVAATKIFQINTEFFQILQFLISRSLDDQLKVVSLVKFLFVECIEVVMLPALLTQVCNCVVLICCYVGRPNQSPVDDPIALLRNPPATSPDTLNILSDLWEIISPLCWSKELMNRGDDTEYEVVRATCALVSVMGSLAPLSGVFKNFIRSLQSAVIRLTINAKTPTQIVSSIESVRILTIAGHVLRDNETTNAILPIFIDLGISIGLNRSLTLMMNDMSDRGIGFLIDRMSLSSQLSPNDISVTLHFLADTLVLRTGRIFALLDSLVSTLDTVCASEKKMEDSHHLYALLNLIEHCGKLDGFLLTVPMIDLVISCSVISDSDIHTHRRNGGHKLATMTSKFFGPHEKLPRNSLKSVRAKAWNVLHGLTKSVNKDINNAIIAERTTDTVLSLLPVGESLRVLLSTLVEIRTHTIPLITKRAHELFVWSLMNLINVDDRLAAHVVALCHPSLEGLDSVTMETCLSLLSISDKSEKLIQQIADTILSKRFFQRLLVTRENPVAPIVSLFPACIPFCDGAGDLVSKFFVNCDQEIVTATSASKDAMRTVIQLGTLLGSFARHQFPEFLHLVTDLTRKETRSKNFLVTFFSSSNTSAELSFGISRIAIGMSCEFSLNLVGDIIPIVRGMYLEPCMETLRAVETGAPNGVTGDRYEINSVPVLSTLIAIEEIFDSFQDLSTDTLNSICSGDAYSSSVFFNEIFSILLPLILFKGQIDSKQSSIPNVSYHAIRALISIARVQKLNTKNFDRAVQFSISLLVHGISSFSTVDTTAYSDRIETVSALLVAVMQHMDKSKLLGMSRLGQSIQLAGSNGPLPILRKITMEVFEKISIDFACMQNDADITHWLECLFVAIPRTRDPITELIATPIVHKLVLTRSVENFAIHDIRTVFKDDSILPSSHLSVFVQLALHASADAYHDSAIYVLELLNDVLRARGNEISPLESSRLTALMFTHSENHETIQPKTIDCIHTLSSIHLSSTMTEMVNSVAAHRALTESQENVIHSICKDKKMLVGLLDYTADIMNNSEPVDNELSQEAHAAATILSEALSVVDSKVSQIVGRNCSQILGTILMYLAEPGDTQLVDNFFGQIAPTSAVHVGGEQDLTQLEKVSYLVTEFLKLKPTAAESLVEFFVTFISRNPANAKSIDLFDTQKITGLVVIQVVVSSDQQTLTPEVWGTIREKVVSVLRKTQNPIMVVNGLKILRKLTSSHLFGLNEVRLVVEILQSATNVDFIDLGIEILEIASRKKNSNHEWTSLFLSTANLIADIIATRIGSHETETNVRVFVHCLKLVQNLCDIAARSDKSVASFKKVIDTSLVVQLVIRRQYLSQVGAADKDLCDITIDGIASLLKKPIAVSPEICEEIVLKYFDRATLMSPTSPSRSPLVTEGAAVAALAVACSHPKIKPKVFARIKQFLKVYKRHDLLVSEARKRVLAHIGDIDWTQ